MGGLVFRAWRANRRLGYLAPEAILQLDPEAEREQIARLRAWRKVRDASAVGRALDELRRAAESGDNVMPASIAAARAGVTTGEWGDALRRVFGEYRAPTGVGGARAPEFGQAELDEVRRRVEALARELGRRPKLLVGKPGLDGHSNGAEQIALRARDAGFEVVYEGIRTTPGDLARAAVDEGVHLVGLSILSGAHLELVPEVIARLRDQGAGDVPVAVGGIILDADAARLRRTGVAAVFTPKDYRIAKILDELCAIIERAHV